MRRSFYLFFILSILVFSCDNYQNQTGNKEKNQDDIRFFSDESFWNQPVSPDAVADSMNSFWISMLERDPSGENIGLNVDSYTIPVYEVDSTVPLVRVDNMKAQIEEWSFTGPGNGHTAEFDSLGVPVMDGMHSSPGTDQHMAIVDRTRGLIWDMFYLIQEEDGNWKSATGIVYPIDGPGVFDRKDLKIEPGQSIHSMGPGVAAGIPIVAGVIRYDEVMQGEIRHKLCGALRYVAFQEFVYPATWTDGNVRGGIPEGAVLQLDPKLDLEAFDLTPEEKVVARALQEYGFVVVDFSAGSTIRAEYLGADSDRSWEGKLRGWSVPGGIKTIPVKHFRVLDTGKKIKGGDNMKEFFKKQLYFEGESREDFPYLGED